MIHLQSVAIQPVPPTQHPKFPFTVPVIQALAGAKVDFTADVTFLVGENGSGKSTFLEALAVAIGSITVGSDEAEQDTSLAPVRPLARKMKLAWTRPTHNGFFMRSEDFFGFTKKLRQMRIEMEQELQEIEEEYEGRTDYAKGLARSPYIRELSALRAKYGEDLDANSHGESFFVLFQSRFVPNGLYLLDEPESPLSPMKQLAFLAMLKTMVEVHHAQFIIATHSPILMAFPAATIYNFDGERIASVAYGEVENVKITKSFLQSPERYLKHL